MLIAVQKYCFLTLAIIVMRLFKINKFTSADPVFNNRVITLSIYRFVLRLLFILSTKL